MGTSAAQISAENLVVRNLVLTQGIQLVQKSLEATGSWVPSSTPVITLKPKWVGLTTGFWLDIIVSIANEAATAPSTLYLTAEGIGNIFSSIIVNDLSGKSRTSTDGYHVILNNTERFKYPLGSIKSITQADSNFGANYGSVSIPTSIPGNIATTPATVTQAKFFMFIPLAYSASDLRGAIYTNTQNAAMNIQLTINPNAFSTVTASAAPALLGPPSAAYANATSGAATITNIAITTRQVYYDDLPAYTTAFAPEFNQGGVLLPVGDLSVKYILLKSQPALSLSANGKSLIPYAPMRTYLSTNLVYNNGNQLNYGTDISEITIEAANDLVFIDLTPRFHALLVENEFEMDLPAGTYYLNRRHSPINTASFGNTNIGFTPSVVNAGAVVIQYDEFFDYMGITSNVQAIGS